MSYLDQLQRLSQRMQGRPQSQSVLRVGKYAIEHWHMQAHQSVLLQSVSLEGATLAAPNGLAPALETLLQPTGDQAMISSARWHVVLDSAWLPVTLLDTQTQIWSPDEVKEIARHRWSALYGLPMSTCLIQTAYLPGDRAALVFGLAQTIKVTLTQALSRHNARVVSMEPSCMWGWRHSCAARAVHSELSWLWCEQDRCLLAKVQNGQVLSLEAAADVPSSWDELQSLVSFPSAPRAVLLSGWQTLPWLPASGAESVLWGSHQGMPLATQWMAHPAQQPQERAA